jgi:hypothetical protein
MKRLKCLFSVLFLGILAFGITQPLLGQQTGTLVFSVKSYTAEATIPKNSQKSLAHGGIKWGMLDNSLLISLVNEKFVKADAPYLTRFGEQKTLDLKAGQYTITCIGIELATISRDPDKVLSKNAFFNNDVLKFTILTGKTTTLEISPIFMSESHWYFLSKLTMYIPDLKVRVLEDGTQKGEDLVINRRTDKSVAWDAYKGPLKF